MICELEIVRGVDLVAFADEKVCGNYNSDWNLENMYVSKCRLFSPT